MNEHVPQTTVRTTQFAEGLPRRAWTVAEFEKACMAGVFDGPGLEDERLELLGGEIVPMSPKGNRHELVRSELHDYWSGIRSIKVASELPLRLSDHSQPQPDIVVYPRALASPDVTPANVLLVVEISDTSLKKDIDTKAGLYAAAGVRDYWVIDANALTTTIFRDPAGTGYQSRHDVAPDQTLTPLHVPELKLTLNDLCI